MPFSALITGPLTVQTRTAARDNERSKTRPNTGTHNSRNLILNPGVRETRSFFPCMTRVFNSIRRSMGLSRPPSTPLNATQRANVQTYECFRKVESSLRKKVVRNYLDCFKQIYLSSSKIESLHRKFHREFDRGLAESFASVLRDKRAQVPKLDFADAVSNAYQSVYETIIDKLLAQPGVYPKGYADTLKAPLDKIILELKSAIAPHVDLPASTPASTPVPEAPVLDDSETLATNTPVGHFSKMACDQFGILQFEVCAKICTEHINEFKAAIPGQECPKNSIYFFQGQFQDHLDAFLDKIPSSGVARKALYEVYRNAMASAVDEAAEEGASLREGEADGLKNYLTGICDDIEYEMRIYADPRIAELFQPERPPLEPRDSANLGIRLQDLTTRDMKDENRKIKKTTNLKHINVIWGKGNMPTRQSGNSLTIEAEIHSAPRNIPAKP